MSNSSITPTTPPEPESVALQMTTQLQGLQPTDLVLWLRQAVPHYLQGRKKLMQQSLLLGFALIVVRDHCPRGSLTNVMKMCVKNGQSSERTLKRCMASAQDFITSQGLASATGKLSEKAEISGLFQSEFDLSISTSSGIMAKIDEYCAMKEDKFEKELIGESNDESLPPDGAKVRRPKTPEQEQRDRWQAALSNLQTEFATGSWKQSFNVELLKAEKWFEKTLKTLIPANKKRQAAEASAAKKARK